MRRIGRGHHSRALTYSEPPGDLQEYHFSIQRKFPRCRGNRRVSRREFCFAGQCSSYGRSRPRNSHTEGSFDRKTIWSNRYDRDISDVFTVQDELTNEIVTALDVELISGEQGRHRRSKYRSTEAGEILYKGMFEHYKFDQYASMAARTYFEKFVSIEPDSILGYAWLVHSWSFALIVGWEAPELALQKLREFVDKSLTIDGDDAHALVGDTYYKTLVGDLDGALESVERATSILPNLDEAWFARGWVQMLLGNPH